MLSRTLLIRLNPNSSLRNGREMNVLNLRAANKLMGYSSTVAAQVFGARFYQRLLLKFTICYLGSEFLNKASDFITPLGQ